jgi:hypothetical protein
MLVRFKHAENTNMMYVQFASLVFIKITHALSLCVLESILGHTLYKIVKKNVAQGSQGCSFHFFGHIQLLFPSDMEEW